MGDLAEQLDEYYRSKRMSDERVEAVLAESKIVPPTSRRLRRWRPAAAAAALLLGAGAALLLWPRHDLAERVAEDVALHHLKNEVPDVAPTHYELIQVSLNRLTFAVMPIRPWLLNHYQPVDGRYCSVLGNPAAQITLKDRREGDVHTLYVTDLIPAFRQLEHQTLYHDGVMVELWTEDNRLFALATDAEL